MNSLMKILPPEDLPYEIKNLSFSSEFKTDEAQGIIRGYPSSFHKTPDREGDIILPGTWLESIEKGGELGSGIKFLWQHDRHTPIGKPIKMKEDQYGLFAETQVAMKTQDGHDAFYLAHMGALDGFSVGYNLHDFEEDREKGTRTFKKAGLYEYSLVTFAMNPRAKITDVKSAIEAAKTPRQLEKSLRDAGVSNKAAKYIVSLCKPSLRVGKEEGNLQDLLKSLNKVNADLLIARMSS